MLTFQSAKSLFTFKRFSNLSISSNIYFGRYGVVAFGGCRGVSSSNVKTIEERMNSINEFNSIQINEKLKKAIVQDFGFTTLSPVQRSILTVLDWQRDEAHDNENGDLLVRAKTGTGKTMAFLVYAIEKTLRAGQNSNAGIPIFILSPTRELALQITEEAKSLVKHLGLRVCATVGGTPRSTAITNIQGQCDIIVATPGRINDLMTNVPLVRAKMSGVQVIVFDEADVLLEMGFANEIASILSKLPSKDQRTTLMFSATVSPNIKAIAKLSMRDGYRDIDCVPKNEIDTHVKIKQSYTIVSYKEQLYLLQDIISKHKQENPLAKIMIFMPSFAMVDYLVEVLNNLDFKGLSCLKIHAKMEQPERTRVSQQFRNSRSSILVTTDVSARGVDYPNVTLVLQVGMPINRQQYVHRIGRTGRANKEGKAMLILSPYEKAYLNLLSKVPIREELGYKPSVSAQDASRIKQMQSAVSSTGRKMRNSVAMSYFSFHLHYLTISGMRKDTVAAAGRDFAKGFVLLDQLPPITPLRAKKLGLAGVPGISNDGDYHSQLPFMSHGTRTRTGRDGRDNRPPRSSSTIASKLFNAEDPSSQLKSVFKSSRRDGARDRGRRDTRQ